MRCSGPEEARRAKREPEGPKGDPKGPKGLRLEVGPRRGPGLLEVGPRRGPRLLVNYNLIKYESFIEMITISTLGHKNLSDTTFG